MNSKYTYTYTFGSLTENDPGLVQEEGCTGEEDHSEVDGKPFQQTSTSPENSSVALGPGIPSGVMPDWRNHAILF